MRNKINKLFLVSLLGMITLTSSSCEFYMKTWLGIKNPKIMDEKLHTQYLKKLKAPADQAYLIDTNYIHFLEVNDTLHFREQKKNHYQPDSFCRYCSPLYDGSIWSIHHAKGIRKRHSNCSRIVPLSRQYQNVILFYHPTTSSATSMTKLQQYCKS